MIFLPYLFDALVLVGGTVFYLALSLTVAVMGGALIVWHRLRRLYA